MVVVSYSGKEINAKLVYYGAGLCGKTTNLEAIYEAVPDTSRGKMVSMKTQSDRTLFFDLLPLDLGEIMGFKTRFLLYTVPGQVFYNATRKLVLKGADAIVFVVDSEVGKMEENKESLANLRANLGEYNISLDSLPWVMQYNKRDLPNIYSIDELNAELNPGGKVPFFEGVAREGKGVFETFRGISHLLMEKVTRALRRSPGGRTAPAEPAETHPPRESVRASAPPPRRPTSSSTKLSRRRRPWTAVTPRASTTAARSSCPGGSPRRRAPPNPSAPARASPRRSNRRRPAPAPRCPCRSPRLCAIRRPPWRPRPRPRARRRRNPPPRRWWRHRPRRPHRPLRRPPGSWCRSRSPGAARTRS